jgi:PhnB protein
MMTQGESPMGDNVPADMKDKIMHPTLEVPGGGVLMGADHPHGKKVPPAGFLVSVQPKDTAEAERVFKGFVRRRAGADEFQKTFWSPGCGICIDKFEVPWTVNCAPAA